MYKKRNAKIYMYKIVVYKLTTTVFMLLVYRTTCVIIYEALKRARLIIAL